MSETLKLMRVEQRTNAKGYTNWYCVFEGRKGEFDKQCMNDSVAQQAQQCVGQVVDVDWNVQQTSYGEWRRVAAVGPSEHNSGVPSSPAAPAPSVSQSAPGAGATSPSNDKEEGMFIMACTKMLEGLNPQDIPHVVGYALWAWRHREALCKAAGQKIAASKVPPPVEQQAIERDMEQDIPF